MWKRKDLSDQPDEPRFLRNAAAHYTGNVKRKRKK
jgi:hypothetical protein